MKTYKSILYVFILISCILISSCDSSIPVFEQQPETISDQRFNGTFTYFHQWEDSWGIEEEYEYTSLRFDGTNKCSYYTKYYSYYNSIGWLYSGDYIGDNYSWNFEIEIQNGLYRIKLWDNEYDDWNDWETYTFSGDGKTLTLENWYNISGNDLVVTK